MSTPEYPGPYRYTDLPPGDSIRYLTLSPGAPNTPLECTLHTTPMASADFEAMSYVWGSDARNEQILCHGSIFHITSNLHKVLHRVRLPDRPRTLWADLICINQEDLDEKGYQVSIMGQIYRRAKRVLIVVGEDDRGHGEAVCSLIDDVCEMIDGILAVIPMGWNKFPYPREDDPLLSDERWDSLRELLKESWFTRGWVVREAGLAQDGLVIWGRSEFSWEKLIRTLNWFYKRAERILYAKGMDRLIPLAHIEVYEDSNPTYAKLFAVEMTWVDQSVLGYLSLTRQLNLKDPRDRIYAFLELVPDTQRRIHLHPNYKDPYLHIYHDFAIEYIRSTSQLGILSHIEHNDDSLAAPIPSWVPRWDLTLTRTGYAFAPADSGYSILTSRLNTFPQPTIPSHHTLSTRGILFDTITHASPVLNIATTTPQTIASIWTSLEKNITTCPFPRPSLLHIFLRTLTAGTREGNPDDWRAGYSAYYAYLYSHSVNREVLVSPAAHNATEAMTALFHNTVQGYTHYRRIVLTERGYVGLAPAVGEVGDRCSVVFGGTTPCVLRVAEVEEGGREVKWGNEGNEEAGKREEKQGKEEEERFKYIGAMYMLGANMALTRDGGVAFQDIFGDVRSKEWMGWEGVEERDILLC